MITANINDLITDSDTSNPQRPELPKKRLFVVVRNLGTITLKLLEAHHISSELQVCVEAHGFLLDHGVLTFYEYVLQTVTAGTLDDNLNDSVRWVFVQYARRAFAAGAWLECEEKVTTVAGSGGVN